MFAIIPAAGYGTRMQAFTRFMSKELLPVKGKCCIDWAIEEAESCGLEPLVVVRAEKEELVRHLGLINTYEIEKAESLEQTVNEVVDNLKPGRYVVILPDMVDTTRRILEHMLVKPDRVYSAEICQYGVIAPFGKSSLSFDKPFLLTGRYILEGEFNERDIKVEELVIHEHIKRLEEWYEFAC